MPATGLQAHFTVIVTVTDTVTLTGLIVTVLDGKHYRNKKRYVHCDAPRMYLHSTSGCRGLAWDMCGTVLSMFESFCLGMCR